MVTFPATARLAWTANPSAEGVTSYPVSVSVNGGAFSSVGNPSSPTLDVAIPGPGTYTFNVQATNNVGTSAPGSTVLALIAPTTPQNITITLL